MTRLLVGGLVGGLILFFWQFLSWSMLNVHGENFTYTPNEKAIMECLNANLSEGGEYFIPGMPPGMSSEEHMQLQMEAAGKPWAKINYRKSFSDNMVPNMIKGFLANLLTALLVCWILMKIPNLSFLNIVTYATAMGLMGFLTIPLINSFWFETSCIGDLVDAVVPWALIGVFLGWWLRRG